MFCREGVTGLRRVVESVKDFPPVLFVFRGTPEDGREFFAHFWPEAKAIADPTGDLFRTFGLFRASWKSLMGPAMLLAAARSWLRGNRNGAPKPDVMREPGLFVIQDEAVIWEHNFQHIGDNPDFAKIPFRRNTEFTTVEIK